MNLIAWRNLQVNDMKFDKKKQKVLWPIFNFPKVYPNLKDGIPSN